MEKLSGIRGEVTEIGWGNQIRSYVLQPYTMVKDHRTGVESGNVDSILDGIWIRLSTAISSGLPLAENSRRTQPKKWNNDSTFHDC